MARRDHSQQELMRKLRAKKYASEEITPILTQLIKEGLLSDARFAENFIYWRRNRGYGPLRIQAELKARGINSDTIFSLLNPDAEEWSKAVRDSWKKRFRAKLPHTQLEKVKQLRFLQQRGFTHEHINSIFASDEFSSPA